MKHIRLTSKESRLEMAQSEQVCGWLFVMSNTKCVDANDPLARLLKQVPVA